jgi:flavodoxin
MIHVIFGSQTGNSEEIAKRIYKEIKEKFKLSHDEIELSVMNKFLQKIQKIPENKSPADNPT